MGSGAMGVPLYSNLELLDREKDAKGFSRTSPSSPASAKGSTEAGVAAALGAAAGGASSSSSVTVSTIGPACDAAGPVDESSAEGARTSNDGVLAGVGAGDASQRPMSKRSTSGAGAGAEGGGGAGADGAACRKDIGVCNGAGWGGGGGGAPGTMPPKSAAAMRSFSNCSAVLTGGGGAAGVA